ncbi:MAG TPA: hypothetical protein VGM02_17460 [Acidobacteriaceae bacterium]|jgi:hypothetical protein
MLIAVGLSPDALLIRNARRPRWRSGLDQATALLCDAFSTKARRRVARAQHKGGAAHTPWQVLEDMRITQHDLLDRIGNANLWQSRFAINASFRPKRSAVEDLLFPPPTRSGNDTTFKNRTG